jgi:hypothetical protein
MMCRDLFEVKTFKEIHWQAAWSAHIQPETPEFEEALELEWW